MGFFYKEVTTDLLAQTHSQPCICSRCGAQVRDKMWRSTSEPDEGMGCENRVVRSTVLCRSFVWELNGSPATNWGCLSFQYEVAPKHHGIAFRKTSSSAPIRVDTWISALLRSTRTAAYWIPTAPVTKVANKVKTANKLNVILAGAPKHSSNCPFSPIVYSNSYPFFPLILKPHNPFGSATKSRVEDTLWLQCPTLHYQDLNGMTV